MASSIPQLHQDTRSDAFLADDNPALVYREKFKDMFGQRDLIAVAVVAEQGGFTRTEFNIVFSVSEAIIYAHNIDPDGVKSLAIGNNITGTEQGMLAEPFFEENLNSQDQPERIRDSIRDFPAY